MSSIITCSLCQSDKTSHFHKEESRQFLICLNCEYVFVPKIYQLSEDEEKSRYDTHNNDPKDVRYRQFLSQLSEPLLKKISDNSFGLDFGSGPGPTLSLMLEDYGHKVALFDKFYAKDTSVFNRKYDFITATEVIEHLSNPMTEINRLIKCLNDGGYLAVMTQILTSKINFSNWYYKNDPSHIGFFSKKTLNYLASNLDLEVEFISERVIFFRK